MKKTLVILALLISSLASANSNSSNCVIFLTNRTSNVTDEAIEACADVTTTAGSNCMSVVTSACEEVSAGQVYACASLAGASASNCAIQVSQSRCPSAKTISACRGM